jgi:hypothetical protein
MAPLNCDQNLVAVNATFFGRNHSLRCRFLRCWPAIVSNGGACASVGSMDKKEINSTKMTLNFLVWIGGVFMLLLFALLAHFVWRLF